MKKNIISLILISTCLFGFSQDKHEYKASLKGFESGSTISVTELLNLKQLTVNSDSITIKKFSIGFVDNHLYIEKWSDSNAFSEDMIQALKGISKDVTFKMYIENIKSIDKSNKQYTLSPIELKIHN